MYKIPVPTSHEHSPPP